MEYLQAGYGADGIQLKRTYLKFPNVTAPAGHRLVSAKLFIQANWPGWMPNHFVPGFPECGGIQGWETDDFGSIAGTNAPAPNVGPAPLMEYHTTSAWYDVSQIVQASGAAVFIVLSPGWPFEAEAEGGRWYMERPGLVVNAAINPQRWPRIVYTFMEDGVKRVEVSVGALKAGYGSE